MHYSFKKKLNKVDSQQNRNFLVPEIDWALNEACNLFVKMIAMPRTPERDVLGFESNQRTIEDIRTIVKSGEDPANQLDLTNNVATIPSDYWYYVRARVRMDKGSCTGKIGTVHIRQHDDMFEESPSDRSSFEWRSVNATFDGSGIRVYTDGTFTVNKLHLTYIRKIKYMHNAEDFRSGSYDLPSGTSLTGTQDCELPEHVHEEIVDLAVLFITGELGMSNYQLKREKVDLNLK